MGISIKFIVIMSMFTKVPRSEGEILSTGHLLTRKRGIATTGGE